jgi:two-component system, response regulator PdtaR
MSVPQIKRKAILIVDDDRLLRDLLIELFTDEGFVVIEAENADQALQQLELAPNVGLLLTDVQMPGELDGVGLVEVVRRRWPNIASIISSGVIQPRFEEMPPQARFVPKPWSACDMLRQVHEALAA